jgi:hypothetical protein
VAKVDEAPTEAEPRAAASDPEKSSTDTPGRSSQETAEPTSQPAKDAENEEPQKLAKNASPGNEEPADEDLCARYFPTVGQTLLVSCSR